MSDEFAAGVELRRILGTREKGHMAHCDLYGVNFHQNSNDLGRGWKQPSDSGRGDSSSDVGWDCIYNLFGQAELLDERLFAFGFSRLRLR